METRIAWHRATQILKNRKRNDLQKSIYVNEDENGPNLEHMCITCLERVVHSFQEIYITPPPQKKRFFAVFDSAASR